jgi:hypothetical protein
MPAQIDSENFGAASFVVFLTLGIMTGLWGGERGINGESGGVQGGVAAGLEVALRD